MAGLLLPERDLEVAAHHLAAPLTRRRWLGVPARACTGRLLARSLRELVETQDEEVAGLRPLVAADVTRYPATPPISSIDPRFMELERDEDQSTRVVLATSMLQRSEHQSSEHRRSELAQRYVQDVTNDLHDMTFGR